MCFVRRPLMCLCFLAACLPAHAVAAAQTTPPPLETIKLPAPKLDKGMPLMQALKKRHTTRTFAEEKVLSMQQLSELLWAADGINRTYGPGENADGRLGDRTAPSAMDRYPIDIYVVLAAAVYRYEPAKNVLAPVMAGDLRKLTGTQAFVATAPLSLVYVADNARYAATVTLEGRLKYAAIETGCIMQNAYLYCASEGLGTVVRTTVPADFAKASGLRPDQAIIGAQTVGVPK